MSSKTNRQKVGNNEGAESADCMGCQARFGAIQGQRNVSKKQSNVQKLMEKMRSNTDKQNRKTEALPARRFRKKMKRARHADGVEKQK